MKCKSVSTVSLISSVTGSRISGGDGPVEWFSIGEVVAIVQRSFPAVSTSKIRYLETRGLISPARTSGGTRRYTRSDIELIERIVDMQTRHFLPLDVIAERISVDPMSITVSGTSEDLEFTRTLAPEMDTASFLNRTGLSNPMWRACQDQGLITRRDTHGAAIGRLVVELGAYGLEPRHLRSLRLSATRIIDLVEATVVRPAAASGEKAAPGALRGGGPGGHTTDARQYVLEHLIHLHTALIAAAAQDSR